MQNILSRIVKYSIYALVFLMPLFFLPFSFEVFEFNKQYLLFFLTTLALFAWLAKQVVCDKEIRFRKTSLDVFVLIFLAAAALSVVFSIDKVSSLYGFYGRFSNSFAGLVSMVILYFLITNNVAIKPQSANSKTQSDGKLQISKIVNLFLWASGAAVLVAYLSVFGVWTKLSEWLKISPLLTQKTFNPAAGSLEGLTIFLAIIISLLVGLMTSGKLDARKNIAYWVLLLASLGVLLIVDYSMAWAVLLATLVLYAGFSIWKRMFKESVNKLLIPVFLIVIAAAAIPFNPVKVALGDNADLVNLPKEEVLSQQNSWSVAFGSATDGVKNIFLGSGLGTFYHDFAKHKPAEINNSWLWQIRFDRAGNHFAEVLATAGFPGLLSYLTIIGLFLMMGYLLMLGIKNVFEAHPFQIPLLLAFLAVLASQFFYYQNTLLAFVFWLVLGLSMTSWRKPIKEKVVSFKDFPELSLVLSTLVIILGVTIILFYFFGARFYLADLHYNKALSLPGGERIQRLEKAINLNPYLSQYRAALSKSYLNETLLEIQEPEESRNPEAIQTNASAAIESARKAIDLQPNQVANWENLGIVYREIAGAADGAVNWGIKSFETALEFEPANPAFYVAIGKLFAVKGDVESAKNNFNSAIEIKPDYAEAIIQLSFLLEREDGLDEAISRLADLSAADPLNVDARFQLGRLYYNNGQADEAIEQFQTVVWLVPDHSNAHYSLGVVFSAQGQKEKAIREFEKVLELNPGNQDVISKLEKLRE